MSLYHKILKREIQYYKDLIRRNNESIRLTKYELFTGNSVYSVKAHQRRLIHLTLHGIRLKEKLERIIRLVH